mmetsp:Transcript_24175/g.37980  ORF Transcript_24175/g.37980 Transcript_24175/m.37980 type:complete len:141 (-) Transcript_24175:282-704(-)
MGTVPRTEEEKAQRAEECLGSLRRLLARPPLLLILGRSGCENAAERLFLLFQSVNLNRHFMLCGLDIVLRALFVELDPKVDDSEPRLEASQESDQVLDEQTAREEALEQALVQAMAQVEALTSQLQELQVNPHVVLSAPL